MKRELKAFRKGEAMRRVIICFRRCPYEEGTERGHSMRGPLGPSRSFRRCPYEEGTESIIRNKNVIVVEAFQTLSL